MSAFNVLIADVKCSNCHMDYKGRIQFKFGNTWQFEYYINDTLKWGGNDIGTPGLAKARVYGILETPQCTLCNNENLSNEFDIIVENDKIKGINPLLNNKDYLIGDGNFVVCSE